MSRNYKFHNPDGVYFVSFAVVEWKDVFKATRRESCGSGAKGTEGMKKVVAAFSDAAKRDILMRRFKSITSESCFKFIETTVIKSIQQTY